MNACKYLARARFKDDAIKDLNKAKDYLGFEEHYQLQQHIAPPDIPCSTHLWEDEQYSHIIRLILCKAIKQDTDSFHSVKKVIDIEISLLHLTTNKKD